MVEEWWSSVPKGYLCVGNIYFNHRSLHKYKRVAMGQDGVEVKSIIDLMLVKEDMLRYMQDVRTVGGMGQGLSNNCCIV